MADRESDAVAPAAAADASVTLPPLSPAKKSRSLRKRVRKMLRKMLFTTEKRAAATSIGLDPNKIDDSPHKLVSASSALAKTSSSRDSSGGAQLLSRRNLADEEDAGEAPLDGESEDTEKDLQELREAHDKLLVKLRHVAQASSHREQALQRQIYVVMLALLALVAWAVRADVAVVR